jgi:hypothetical protein
MPVNCPAPPHLLPFACGKVENIPLQAERHSGPTQKLFAFPPESVFAFRPECCSDSQRNAVRLQTGIAFSFDRIPHPTSKSPTWPIYRYALWLKYPCSKNISLWAVEPLDCDLVDSGTCKPEDEGDFGQAIDLYTQSPMEQRIAAQESALNAILKQPTRRARIGRVRHTSKVGLRERR